MVRTVEKSIAHTLDFLGRALGIRLQGLDQCVQQVPSAILPHAPEGIREGDEDGSHIGRHGRGIAILRG